MGYDVSHTRRIDTTEGRHAMTTSAVADRREQIRKADEDVLLQQERLGRIVDGIGARDGRDLEAFNEAMVAWATRFNRSIPDSLPSDARDEIRDHLLQGLEVVRRDDVDDRPLDGLNDLLLHLEAVRHILRDAVDGPHGVEVASPAHALDQIDGWLPGLGRAPLAELLGVTPRTLQRWSQDGGPVKPRVAVVTQLVALLRRTWTPEGVVAWFHRPRRDLGGRAPIDLLDDASRHPELLEAARRGRASHGA